MTTFWLAASALIAIALGFLLYPLWRERRRSGAWSLSGLVAVLVTVPIAVGLYYDVRTYDPGVASKRAAQMRLVDELAEKMQQRPDDVEGWRLLARSYLALGVYDRALAAMTQAWQHTAKPDNSLKLDYAEAQVLADQAALEGPAGELIEQVLADEPQNPRALWYGGERAFQLGKSDLARARLTRLLALNVAPPDITHIIDSQLAELPAAGASGAGAAQGAAEAAAPPSAAQSAAAASGPSVRIKVRLGEKVSGGDLKPTSALLIFARAPGGGPPVAVIRQPATALPGEFVLSDANAMIPGRSLGDFQELQLVARISQSGQAQAQPGDLEGETAYHPRDDRSAELVIDKVVQ